MKIQSALVKAYRYKSRERGLPSPFGESLSRKSGGRGRGKKAMHRPKSNENGLLSTKTYITE